MVEGCPNEGYSQRNPDPRRYQWFLPGGHHTIVVLGFERM